MEKSSSQNASSPKKIPLAENLPNNPFLENFGRTKNNDSILNLQKYLKNLDGQQVNKSLKYQIERCYFKNICIYIYIVFDICCMAEFAIN